MQSGLSGALVFRCLDPTISIILEVILRVKSKSKVILRFVGLHKNGGVILDNLAFIARYEALLRERKMLKGTFYQACGITDAAVSQWRKGKTSPSMKTIGRIAEFLGVSLDYLLTDLGEKEKAPTPKDRIDEEIMRMYLELDEPYRKLMLDYANFLLENQNKLPILSEDDDIESQLEHYKQGLLMGITAAQAGKIIFPPVDFNSLEPELRAAVEADLKKEREKLLAERQSKK